MRFTAETAFQNPSFVRSTLPPWASASSHAESVRSIPTFSIPLFPSYYIGVVAIIWQRERASAAARVGVAVLYHEAEDRSAQT